MYTAKDYSHLIGMDGLSEEQLTIHFGLYNGYVNNTNALIEKLNDRMTKDLSGPEYSELKRHFGWEFDGMRMHEYYFDNLTKESNSLDEQGPLAKKIIERFGSVGAFKDDFLNTAKTRGIGWTMLVQDPVNGQIHNLWVQEHNEGIMAGCNPLLVLDMWEHAFVFDFKMNKADYLEAFFNAIDWKEVEGRLI